MEGSGVAFKFCRVGIQVEAVVGPQLVTPAIPGPRCGRGRLTPNAVPTVLLPLPLKAPDGPGIQDGTAARTLTRRDTQVTTKLKLRSGGKERKKDFSSVCCWGPRHTGWAYALGRGRLALKESSKGAGGYRAGTSLEIMYKGGGCPRSAPNRAEVAHGGGVHVGGAAPFGVSPSNPWVRVPQRVMGWE